MILCTQAFREIWWKNFYTSDGMIGYKSKKKNPLDKVEFLQQKKLSRPYFQELDPYLDYRRLS